MNTIKELKLAVATLKAKYPTDLAEAALVYCPDLTPSLHYQVYSVGGFFKGATLAEAIKDAFNYDPHLADRERIARLRAEADELEKKIAAKPS